MKLTTRTRTVLDNFCTINPSLLVRKGNILMTESGTRAMMARADLEEENTFDHDFAIYDLKRFLGVLSLFDDPELHFEENRVVVEGGDRRLVYAFCDPSLLHVKPPSPEKVNVNKFSDPYVQFELSDTVLQTIRKAIGILGQTQMVFVGENGRISIRTGDSRNSSADVYSVSIGDTDKSFRAIFRLENMKFVPTNYQVKVTDRGAAAFVGDPITYFVALEENSQFE